MNITMLGAELTQSEKNQMAAAKSAGEAAAAASNAAAAAGRVASESQAKAQAIVELKAADAASGTIRDYGDSAGSGSMFKYAAMAALAYLALK